MSRPESIEQRKKEKGDYRKFCSSWSSVYKYSYKWHLSNGLTVIVMKLAANIPKWSTYEPNQTHLPIIGLPCEKKSDMTAQNLYWVQQMLPVVLLCLYNTEFLVSLNVEREEILSAEYFKLECTKWFNCSWLWLSSEDNLMKKIRLSHIFLYGNCFLNCLPWTPFTLNLDITSSHQWKRM